MPDRAFPGRGPPAESGAGAPGTVRVVHALPGRVRLHVPRAVRAPRDVERLFLELPGVFAARADALTGNVLVRFRPETVSASGLLRAAGVGGTAAAAHRPEGGAPAGQAAGAPHPSAASAAPSGEPPAALVSTRGHERRARITVRGLDRSPALGKRVEEALERLPGVRATASPLTGRVLVEITEREVELEDLLGIVARLEFPEIPGELRPSHALDAGPLRQSALRLGASLAGLALVALRQLAGVRVGVPGAAHAAYVTSILNSIPPLHQTLARLVGRDVAEAAITLPNIAAQTLNADPIGLTLTGGEAAALFGGTRSRRTAWRAYEHQLGAEPSATPGTVVRLESGDGLPLQGRVVAGTGSATGPDGMPRTVGPGSELASGTRLFGGPFVVELGEAASFLPEPRQEPIAAGVYDRYLQASGPLSLAYAAATALATRSLDRTFAAMLLVNPRVAMVGERSAKTLVASRVLRAGVTVVGTRPERHVRRPHTLIVDGARLLTNGVEVKEAIPLQAGWTAEELRRHAAGVAAAAGVPYAGLHPRERVAAREGRSGGGELSALVGGVRFVLRPTTPGQRLPAAVPARQPGTHRVLLLSERGDAARGSSTPERDLLGVIILRPRFAAGVQELVRLCREYDVALLLLDRAGSPHARHVAERAGMPLSAGQEAVPLIRGAQAGGRIVAFASDGAQAGHAFSACDLAIAITDRRHRFSARADLLATDLLGVAAILEAGVRRDEALTDAVVLSAAGNLVGAALGLRGLAVNAAGQVVETVALGALAAAFLRLRGGERPTALLTMLRDPHPERWGRLTPADVLREVSSTEQGLTSAQAARRQVSSALPREGRAIVDALLAQIRSPISAVIGAAALLSLILGGGADVLIIAGTLGINLLLGVWQERKAGRVTEELHRLQAFSARVLRDGRPVTLPSTAVVRGDVLLLAPGDRVPGDARLLAAAGLEVDEAALTGESLPVRKLVAGGDDAQHVLLDGSDVVCGSARAVAFAVGRQSRLGSTAAALALQAEPTNPLSERLSQILDGTLPIALVGGLLVAGTGLLRGEALLAQLALGISVVVAAVPEGLPLLAGVGEATVASRLTRRQAIVRRLASVEALGRVDVACVDKTGTLTEGRLALQVLASLDGEATPDQQLSRGLRHLLRAAALASPHPDAWAATRDGTDLAVLRAADRAGLREEVRAPRTEESPFEPQRPFHLARVGERVYAKGAPEALLDRCDRVREAGQDVPLTGARRAALEAQAARLASHALRVLLVTEADAAVPTVDPRGLTALGLVAMSDPLRAGVAEAVRRCHDAGVRVLMLTGDHPETARSIARAASLADGGGMITGAEIRELDDAALADRLESATVVARATPLDKLRIVEGLRSRGHTVAMTGDGVNDAPALRLADVGVAMGHGGTDVARQAADVVLSRDDFSTLVEALVEGRGFWRNLRQSVGMLLGGNLGELGIIVGASALGGGRALTVHQVLLVNLVTDLLPGIALVMQSPEDRRLSALAREGMTAFDGPLRADILRRALATAVPSLGVLASAGLTGSDPRSAGFAALVATQLAQTVEAGRRDGAISRPVAGAAALSAATVVAAFGFPAARSLLRLRLLTPAGTALVLAAAVISPALNHALTLVWRGDEPLPRKIPAAAGTGGRTVPALS